MISIRRNVTYKRGQSEAAIKWVKQQHGIGIEALLDAQEIAFLAERRC